MTAVTNKYVTVVATVFLIGFLFYILHALQSILLPFFIAIILSFVFEPLLVWLKKKKVPTALGIFIILLLIIIITNIAIFRRMPKDLPGRGSRATQAPDVANPLHLLPRPGTIRRLSVRFLN